MPKLPNNISEDQLCKLVKSGMFGLENPGICEACGEIQEGCEPDARNYECETCGENSVHGAAEYLF